MKIKSVRISNFRCFQSADIVLGKISVFIGQNNSGKTSILKSILSIQTGVNISSYDVRAGVLSASIILQCENISHCEGIVFPNEITGTIAVGITTEVTRRGVGINLQLNHSSGNISQIQPYSSTLPNNCLIPYLSKRKAGTYVEDVRLENAIIVGDMSRLPAKLSRISNPTYPGHEAYKKSCIEILGFMLTSVASENGQKAGMYLEDGSVLPIDVMGEGVPNIVALLIELVTAKGKIFVIEEPENDLHPKALKSLLKLILASSQHNQIIVSTHSNIVVQYLGVEKDSLFYVKQVSHSPPTSEIEPVDSSPYARMEVLRELGYALSDFDLWDGWLILEESSAERIIRDYLIPFFAPKLSSVRTLAANGVNEVEPTFNDFHRLVKFNHLEDVYRNSTWVRVDGDAAGAQIIERLRDNYKTWNADQFGQFSKPQFESYYPEEFSKKIETALATSGKQQKREAKRLLLNEVLNWLAEDRERAKVSLEKSAAEIIYFLKQMESKMK